MRTADALQVLTELTVHARHQFWADDLGYNAVGLRGVVGHRQVTDAYLAQLARVHDGRVATSSRPPDRERFTRRGAAGGARAR